MDLIGFGYAALVTIGSVLGYKRRGGVPSLIAGLSVGLLAGYGAYRVSNDRRDVKVSLFTAFFLATIMGVRFKRSKKVMPAGLVAGLREYFQVASGKLGHRKNESPLLPLRRAVTEPSEPTAQGHDRAVHSRPVHQRDCPSVFLFL
ncbi:transmembrane protein 14A isoform 1 [Mus musculus]|uniref:Transmembrane protein 14A n=2 Tax=Mus musculus TaxID=10090 RepID=D3YV08_MOUSE|nr:transmembrane protein 14A isoform 1 [Mus musculus]EDL14388.1 transmembrane protein 14A, isoform CRA_b [Mus musculus]|eukprot:NP_001277608.1 transmembrane protein 14A isoform 1 [Mus musculus]